MTTNNEFKILNEQEHVLIRSNRYVGNTTYETQNILLDSKFTDVRFIPALFKILNELIDNSMDEAIRTNFEFANKITVTMTDDTFTILDNGRGIPITKVLDTDGKEIYKPVAAWTKLRAGSNFNDSERIGAGMNGEGAALSCIFSRSFYGTTADGKNQLNLVCKDNAVIESVNVKKSTKKFTEVSLTPDFTRFETDKFDDTIKKLIKDRLISISLAYPEIKTYFNNELCTIPVRTYIKTFENAIIHTDTNISIAIMPNSTGDFKHHSIINGLTVYRGGSHIDYVMNNIVQPVREGIKKKYKFDILPSQIKNHLQLITIIKNFRNVKFDSQTKERLTNTNAECAEHLSQINYEKIGKEILKSDAIILPIIETQLAKQRAQELAEERKKAKKLKSIKVASHIPATGNFFEQKSLFLVEGISAGAPFASVRDAKTQGLLPLRGKILNTFDKTNKEILDNKVLKELMAVIGLELGKPIKNLNYGTIVIMTDQDVDGGAIQCLLVNFFYNWPDLFKEGRVKILNSPLYILRGKKDRKFFYTKEEFENYTGSLKGYEVAYIKGLGSLRLDEYRDMLNDPYYQTVTINDKEKDLLSLMYAKDTVPRKKYLMGEDYAA